jgi:hypothetical protein
VKQDLCKTPPFAQFWRQAQILSLEILNVFLHLKFSPSLNLNKIEHFSKVSNGNDEQQFSNKSKAGFAEDICSTGQTGQETA